jgi:uncharacterized protein (DUF1697 family)
VARYIALLRAINVGEHTVRMADLKRSFEALGFDGVATFMASGNVVFESDTLDEAKLERTIERALEADLGYPVETVVRSMTELGEIAGRDPFVGRDQSGDKRSVYVAFLGRTPTPAAVDRLLRLATEDDEVTIVDRETYWLRRGGIGTSKFTGGLLEKTLGMPATLRGLPTIRRIVAKFG